MSKDRGLPVISPLTQKIRHWAFHTQEEGIA